MKTTKLEVEEACEEMKSAMLIKIDLEQKIEKIQIESMKNQKRLSLAQDRVRALRGF